jgi:hypothetical protein
MFRLEDIKVFRCEIHNKYIYHSGKPIPYLEGWICWDCWRADHHDILKEENRRRNIKQQFAIDFSDSWVTSTRGGILSTRFEKDGFHIEIESSAEVCQLIPNKYMGYTIVKHLVGEQK